MKIRYTLIGISVLMIGLTIGGITLKPTEANTETKPISGTEVKIVRTPNPVTAQSSPGLQSAKDKPQVTSSSTPATQEVSQPTVETSTPGELSSPPPEQAPVTITAVEKISVDENTTDCQYTYSDGSTYRWTWQTSHYNQGQKETHTYGQCDDSVIGRVKS